VPRRTCAVTDARGVRHTAEVSASSLFEAAVLAVQVLRRDGWIEDAIGGGSKLEVEVREPATRHMVTMLQIKRWLNGATISPNERVKKDRLRSLLTDAAARSPRAG
jgi:hypothetical protein